MSPARYSRRLKSQFQPLTVEAFFFADRREWDRALAAGAVLPYRQGAQPGGQPRNPKYLLDLPKARQQWLVGEVALQPQPAA